MDKESYYYGRVTGDCITMIAGAVSSINGAMTIAGGISLTEGGVILTSTGGGAVIGIPAIAVSVPVVAVGVLEMAGSASIAYSGYSNMNDNIQKINEINSSPNKPDIGDIKKAELADGIKENINNINNHIELKGSYTPEYAEKLQTMYEIFKSKGYELSEHSLNRIQGRINQGKIGSIDDVLDVLENGTKYNDTINGGTVIFKDGISVHFAEDGTIKTVIGKAKIKSTWEVIQ